MTTDHTPADGDVGLTPERASRIYDRLGRLQDSQRFYETPALENLIAHARLDDARSVFELGCGTGATAVRLLDDVLAPTATYHAVDVSQKMVSLTSERLERFGDRAKVERIGGRPPLPGPTGGYDRFLALYVLDLLDPAAAAALVDDARRLLAPDGLLCLVSLTHGTTTASRALSGAWNRISRVAPGLLGGCRPIDLTSLLDGWRIAHIQTTVAWAVPSQVVIAAPPHSP